MLVLFGLMYLNNTHIFQVLLSNGADVNAGLTDRSPLHYAVLSDAPDVVSALLAAGACPDTPQV